MYRHNRAYLRYLLVTILRRYTHDGAHTADNLLSLPAYSAKSCMAAIIFINAGGRALAAAARRSEEGSHHPTTSVGRRRTVTRSGLLDGEIGRRC